MEKFFITGFFVFLMSVLNAQHITGHWGGTLNVQGVELKIVFHVSQSADSLVTTMDSPNQGVRGIPMGKTEYKDSLLIINAPSLNMKFSGKWQTSDKIEGTFTQSGLILPLELVREKEENTFLRPQEPKPPYPYQVEEVTFKNLKAGITLSGTLTLPIQGDNYPVVILISGSGPQNRDEEIMGHKPFLVLADYLTREGIGVLRFDDRGVGKSTGDFEMATSLDFAEDVEAAVSFLKNNRKIRRIGLIGHSEGGMIAPIVASRSKEVDFIVLLAAPGLRGDHVLLKQQSEMGRMTGASEKDLTYSEIINRKCFDLVLASTSAKDAEIPLKQYMDSLNQIGKLPVNMKNEKGAELWRRQVLSPWMYFFVKYDPVPVLKKVKCPVLALNGSNDLQVFPENLEIIRKGLEAGKHKHVTVKELPSLNHLFQTCESGSPTLYAMIPETFSLVALKEIGDWIKTLK